MLTEVKEPAECLFPLFLSGVTDPVKNYIWLMKKELARDALTRNQSRARVYLTFPSGPREIMKKIVS